MSSRWFGVAVACAAAGAGCDDLAPVVSYDASPVQTDSLVYTLKRDTIPWSDGWRGEGRTYVLATYRNVGTATVYFVRCTSQDSLPVYGFRRTGPDSTREVLSDQGWACLGGPSTGAIVPGAAVTVRVNFGSVDQPHMQRPEQLGWLVGLFRVELELCRSYASASDDCDPLPQAESQSNAFEVGF